jgi:hypothetical protein
VRRRKGGGEERGERGEGRGERGEERGEGTHGLQDVIPGHSKVLSVLPKLD